MKKKLMMIVLCLVIFPVLSHGITTGDTQGNVIAAKVIGEQNDIQTIEIWFSNPVNDRWGCIANPGYIRISDAHPKISSKALSMMMSVALTAQTTGKQLAVDSSGTDQCNSGVHVWMVQ